jgi:hypothetical protein
MFHGRLYRIIWRFFARSWIGRLVAALLIGGLVGLFAYSKSKGPHTWAMGLWWALGAGCMAVTACGMLLVSGAISRQISERREQEHPAGQLVAARIALWTIGLLSLVIAACLVLMQIL